MKKYDGLLYNIKLTMIIIMIVKKNLQQNMKSYDSCSVLLVGIKICKNFCLKMPIYMSGYSLA